MVKFLALLGGTMAVKAFVRQTIESNAALYRFSQNLEESATTVSEWGNAAEIAGGSAGGLQGTMQMLSRAQTEVQTTGQSSILPWFNKLGMSMQDLFDPARSVADVLLDLSDRFSHMDRKHAFNIGTMMGIDPGTMNLLLEGRRAVQAAIRDQEQYARTREKLARESEPFRQQVVQLRQKFEDLGNQLLLETMPVLEKMLDIFTGIGNWMRQNKEVVKVFLEVLAAGIAAVAVAALPFKGIAAAILGVAAAIRLLWQDYQVWKSGGKSLIDWGEFGAGVETALKKLGELKGLMLWLENHTFAGLVWKHFHGGESGGNAGGESPSTAAPSTPGFFKRQALKFGRFAGGSKMAREQAMNYFMAQGWTKEQAAGIVANLQAESGFNPSKLGDSGAAYGIAQWHKDRQAELERVFGKPISQATYEDQLAFVQYELTQGKERAAGNALKGATSAEQAGAIVSKKYERPAAVEGAAAQRGALATQIAGASQFARGAGASAGASTHVTHNSVPKLHRACGGKYPGHGRGGDLQGYGAVDGLPVHGSSKFRADLICLLSLFRSFQFFPACRLFPAWWARLSRLRSR